MARSKVPLNEAAEAFRVHPRTILRAIEGEENVYWTEDHDPDIKVSELAAAYGCKPAVLNRVFEGRDSLLTADEAAKELGIRPRTFRRDRPRHLKHGGIVRYERSVIVTRAFGE